jgi:putative transcriptional regulator
VTITKNRLKEFRAKHDMTQENLAVKLGITRQTIIAIEKERYNPSLTLAFKMAKLFDCLIEQIFLYDNPE